MCVSVRVLNYTAHTNENRARKSEGKVKTPWPGFLSVCREPTSQSKGFTVEAVSLPCKTIKKSPETSLFWGDIPERQNSGKPQPDKIERKTETRLFLNICRMSKESYLAWVS